MPNSTPYTDSKTWTCLCVAYIAPWLMTGTQHHPHHTRASHDLVCNCTPLPLSTFCCILYISLRQALHRYASQRWSWSQLRLHQPLVKQVLPLTWQMCGTTTQWTSSYANLRRHACHDQVEHDKSLHKDSDHENPSDPQHTYNYGGISYSIFSRI